MSDEGYPISDETRPKSDELLLSRFCLTSKNERFRETYQAYNDEKEFAMTIIGANLYNQRETSDIIRRDTLNLSLKQEENMNQFNRITFDANLMGGRACIRGMRVTVSLILNLIANKMTAADIIKEYPYLENADITQSLQYAAWLADENVQILEPA
jgi:uncharacterized protein (DUF433 family)